MVSLDQVKEAAGKYNLTNKDGTYSQMGFGPSWDEDFLYLVTKENGPVFKERGTAFSWNQDKLNKSVQFIKNWTTECNQSTTAELDFEFKYLYQNTDRLLPAELFLHTLQLLQFLISDMNS